jgi:hypothetical protein
MNLVSLHGIGDGDPAFAWLDGLNRGLMQAGHESFDRKQVIAPRYSSYLKAKAEPGNCYPSSTSPRKKRQPGVTSNASKPGCNGCYVCSMALKAAAESILGLRI